MIPIFGRNVGGNASLLGEGIPQEVTEGMELSPGKWMGNQVVAENRDQLAVYQRDEPGGGEGHRLEAGEK